MKEFDYKHSDDKLKQKLEGFEMTPPENAWSGIQNGLPGNKRRRGFFLWSVLLLLLIGGAATTYVMTMEPNGIAKPTTSANKNFKNNNTDNTHKNSGNPISTDTEKQLIAENSNTTESSVDVNPSSGKNTSPNTLVSNSTTKTDEKSVNDQNSAAISSGKREKNNSTSSNTSDGKDNSTANSDKKNPSESASNNSKGDNAQNTPLNNSSVNTNTTSAEEEEQNASISVAAMESLKALEIENLPYSPQGQGDFSSKPMKTPRRANWSAELGIGLSSFSYSPKASAGNNLQTYIKDAQTKEIGRDFYARINYHLNPLISLHTGAEFQQNSYNVNYQTSSTTTFTVYDTTGWYFDTLTQQQIPIVDSSTATNTTFQDQMIQNSESLINIPIGIRFHVPLGVRSQLGIAATGLVGIRTKATGSILVDENGQLVDMNTAYRKSGNLSMRLSVRYSYMLNENFAVYAEPWYGFGLNNRSTNGLPYETKFSNTGIYVGIRKNF